MPLVPVLSSHFVPTLAPGARLTQIFSGSVPLQPRKVLTSNPDSHSPRYSRVESTTVFAARDWLLGVDGGRTGAARPAGRAHIAVRATMATKRTKCVTPRESLGTRVCLTCCPRGKCVSPVIDTDPVANLALCVR